MTVETMGRGWTDFLSDVPLFSGVAKRHLNKIAEAAQSRRFLRYSTIVRAGEPGDTFFVILDGAVLVKPPGKRPTRLRAGDSFGELALLDDAPRSATVEADDDEVTVMLIGRKAFKQDLGKRANDCDGAPPDARTPLANGGEVAVTLSGVSRTAQ